MVRLDATARLAVLALCSSAALAACSSGESSAGGPGPQFAEATTGAEVAAPPAQVEGKEVEYAADGTQLKGFIAYPGGAATKRPGVLVIHEWWGHNEYARARAKQLAELGYVALAVDMYGEGKQASHPDDAKKMMMEVMSNLGVMTQRFNAAKALLQSDARVDGERIGAIGYCMGGAVALNMARAGADLDVIGVFHGNLAAQQPMATGAFKGKILVANGAADPFVPAEQVQAFEKEMQAAGASYVVRSYPNAKHAFTNPAATEAGQKFQLPIAYDADADRASWQELTQLLAQVWPPES
jgi:dienelactone hydrolase